MSKKFDGWKLCDASRCMKQLSSTHYIVFDKHYFCSDACVTKYIEKVFKDEGRVIRCGRLPW